MKEKTIFSPAKILLPTFHNDSEKMSLWSVIACDQFTSEIAYWARCQEQIGDSASTYRYILPEAYLGKEEESIHSQIVKESMERFDDKSMADINGLIYVERTLPNGKVRRGLVGKMDLEAYDFSVGSASPIRATEATVVERIPARCAVRALAKTELPHILVLIDDGCGVFDLAESLKAEENKLYDFALMAGGGHIKGYALTGEALDTIMSKIFEYEKTSADVVYAMGDGNHSLAAAKANWENCKKAGADMHHPARYALCEITPLGDDSLVFEPIYRILQNVDKEDFLEALDSVTAEGNGEETVTVIASELEKVLHFTKKTHALTVGTLQNFIDAYIASHPGVVCDYIHGEEALRNLSGENNAVGFILDGMDKSGLFSYVSNHGTLPRKTFSMGEAESKRYYLEMRKIIK